MGFPPAQAAAARELAERNRAAHDEFPDFHDSVFDRLAETLTLRYQMHQEFE
jgi:hypothetical protein